jgi:hypothetical protein
LWSWVGRYSVGNIVVLKANLVLLKKKSKELVANTTFVAIIKELDKLVNLVNTNEKFDGKAQGLQIEIKMQKLFQNLHLNKNMVEV